MRAEDFFNHVQVLPSGCWFWKTKTVKHYGSVWFNGKTTGAHKVAWIITNGPVPDGMQVLHTCDNPPCCNPAHLFLGTNADNAADRHAKGRTKLVEVTPELRAKRSQFMMGNKNSTGRKLTELHKSRIGAANRRQ